MKKTLIALAALSAIAGAAQAQSTVTLYGRVDANLGSFTTNEANTVNATAIGATTTTSVTQLSSLTKTKMADGGFNGSRFGMKGAEELGGGLSAIFNFEAGFAVDSGASGQGALFGRRANVGLAGGFGKVEFGRNSSPYDDVSGDHAMMQQSLFDPSNTNNGPTSLTSSATIDGASSYFLTRSSPSTWVGYSTRFNNSIKYTTNDMSGFSASLMYALGEDNTNAGNGLSATKSISAFAKYTNGPLLVSLGYQSEGAAAAAANTAGTTPALVNMILNASYDIGMAKFGFGYNQAKFQDVTLSAYTVYNSNGTTTPVDAHGMSNQNEYSLSVAVPLGATTLSAGYAVSQGDDLGKATGYGLQAKYALSKRTFVYGGYQNTTAYDNLVNYSNAYNARYRLGTVQDHISSYAVGINHAF